VVFVVDKAGGAYSAPTPAVRIMKLFVLAAAIFGVCVESAGFAMGQGPPPFPPGSVAVVTVTTVQPIQMGPYWVMRVDGQWNGTAQAVVSHIEIKLEYVNANGQLTGFAITQNIYSPPFPNYSMTIMNMPQTNQKFIVRARIYYDDLRFNPPRSTSYTTLANNGALYNLPIP
jgi:hypothetical protein